MRKAYDSFLKTFLNVDFLRTQYESDNIQSESTNQTKPNTHLQQPETKDTFVHNEHTIVPFLVYCSQNPEEFIKNFRKTITASTKIKNYLKL